MRGFIGPRTERKEFIKLVVKLEGRSAYLVYLTQCSYLNISS